MRFILACFFLSVLCFTHLIPGESQAIPPVNALESIYVSTDRNVFYAGETVWYKIWCFGEGQNETYGLSKSAYIELLNAANKPVVQQRIQLVQGTGNGCFSLPLTLESGVYILRSYTNWMKNFGPATFFHKSIVAINPGRDFRFDLFKRKPVPEDNSSIFRFYPEGGSIVKNIRSRVYVGQTLSARNTIPEGAIINDQNDTVARLKNITNNLAYAEFIPQTENYYLVAGKINPWKVALPKVLEKGYNLSFGESAGKYIFSLDASDTSFVNQNLFIEVTNKLNTKTFRKSFSNLMNIEKSRIPDGLNRIQITDMQGKIVATNYLYKSTANRIILRAELDKIKYRNREKVEMNIASLSSDLRPLKANLTISVSKRISHDSRSFNMPMYKDFGNCIGKDVYNMDLSNADMLRAFLSIYGIDAFAATTGENSTAYPREKSGQVIAGKLFSGNVPKQSRNIYLSAVGDSSLIFITSTDSSGYFQVPISYLSGKREVMIKADDSIKRGTFSLMDDFSPSFLNFVNLYNGFDSLFVSRAANMYFAWQVQKQYELKNYKEPSVYSGRFDFFGKPDFSTKVKDYIELPLMEEFFFEIVKPVMVFHNQKEPYLKVIDKITNRTIGDHPLYLVDGIPFSDPTYLMSIPPSKVRQISVVAQPYYLGPMVFDGIVIANTYARDFSDVDYKGTYIRKKIQFNEPVLNFNSPSYNSEESNKTIPDYRNTLYWNPELKTNTDGKAHISFFTSDECMDYDIVIEGNGESGEAGYTYLELKVENQKEIKAK